MPSSCGSRVQAPYSLSMTLLRGPSTRLRRPDADYVFPERVLRVEDVSRLLGRPIWKIHQLCNCRDLPNVKVGNTRFLLESRLNARLAPTADDVAAGRSPWEVLCVKLK